MTKGLGSWRSLVYLSQEFALLNESANIRATEWHTIFKVFEQSELHQQGSSI